MRFERLIGAVDGQVRKRLPRGVDTSDAAPIISLKLSVLFPTKVLRHCMHSEEMRRSVCCVVVASVIMVRPAKLRATRPWRPTLLDQVTGMSREH